MTDFSTLHRLSAIIADMRGFYGHGILVRELERRAAAGETTEADVNEAANWILERLT